IQAIVRRRASGTAFPRWSVRNDNLNGDYPATLCVACRYGRSASNPPGTFNDLDKTLGAK
ncbi:hypothetical protein, partial [Pseudomonas syringae group genomosp. 7]|uniref:hypothetical protein n=1 Tax=Pseudomonas syringae group genomosp. 7 TaxID=251699 RepID=UPI0037703ECD